MSILSTLLYLLLVSYLKILKLQWWTLIFLQLKFSISLLQFTTFYCNINLNITFFILSKFVGFINKCWCQDSSVWRFAEFSGVKNLREFLNIFLVKVQKGTAFRTYLSFPTKNLNLKTICHSIFKFIINNNINISIV